VIEAACRHPRLVLLAAGCYLAINLNYYIFNTFLISYVVSSHIQGLSQAHVLAAVLIASAVELLWLPIAGLLSDEFGRTRVFTLGAALLAAWSFVFWPLVNTGSFMLLLLALVVGLGLLHSTMYGPQPAMFSEAFDVSVRYSGVSLGVQLGSLVGGAFAPFIATALLAKFGAATPIAIYMSAGCVITFACGLKLRRHRMTARKFEPATPTTM
jgi:MFS family permease